MKKTIGLVVGLVLAGAGITGCEKPPPAISVWSGSDSVNVKAQCWSFEDAGLDARNCAQDILQGTRTDGLPSLPTQPGNTFGISVDPVVAESGWQVRVNGQSLTPEPLDTNYFRAAYAAPAQPIVLQVVAGGLGEIRGVWLLELDPTAG
jgi:hypothetical protein